MLTIEAPRGARLVMVSFRRGEYILEALTAWLQEQKVDAALIASGVGSLDICRLHTITGTGLPPEERYFTLEGPLEVGSLQGSVAGGEPHIHVVIHHVAEDRTYVGHLEPGSRCCYRLELGLALFSGVHTVRLTDPLTQLTEVVERGD